MCLQSHDLGENQAKAPQTTFSIRHSSPSPRYTTPLMD